jgi:hypothetical protein
MTIAEQSALDAEKRRVSLSGTASVAPVMILFGIKRAKSSGPRVA